MNDEEPVIRWRKGSEIEHEGTYMMARVGSPDMYEMRFEYRDAVEDDKVVSTLTYVQRGQSWALARSYGDPFRFLGPIPRPG